MKKELKSGILSADKSADCRPTVGGANVIAVLARRKKKEQHFRILLVSRLLQRLTHFVTNMQYEMYCDYYKCKNDDFQMKSVIFYLFLVQNIDCGCSFESPHSGGTNEYPQSML